ncbi:MAG: polysaccharide pyruvyl transferase family protein [Clostridium sp.]|nr:polysaccharide pyruvyl transferase family protein [Clostridium sp.]
MKIGILTLPFHVNYGGILQAYALQTKLQELGHNVCFIEFGPYFDRGNIRRYLSYIKQYIIKLLGRKRNINKSTLNKNNARLIKKFCTERMAPMLQFDSPKQFRLTGPRTIIVGSDQIWRGENYYDLNKAFLIFANGCDIKRIAYAASFGQTKETLQYTAQQIKTYTHQLSLFDTISVREESGVDICKELLNCDATCVLDPTMLLTCEDYIQNLGLKKDSAHKGIYSYILDSTESKKNCIQHLSSDLNKNVYSVLEEEGQEECKQLASIESWIQGFIDAEYVVTDSFHGVVFSILFNKPFVVFLNELRGTTRFDTILSRFDLHDRVTDINNKEEITKKMKTPINWNRINTLLQDYRKKSMRILESI